MDELERPRSSTIFFLDDAEDAGRRIASLLPTRNRRSEDPHIGLSAAF
jgi:hypothetical protein